MATTFYPGQTDFIKALNDLADSIAGGGPGGSVVGLPWIDPQAAPYYAVPGSSDSTSKFQQIINDYKDIGGCLVLITATYTISKLKIPDPICFIGFNNSIGVLQQKTGTIGAMIEAVAYRGKSVGQWEHLFERITLDGNLVGITKSSGRTAAGSASVTNITPSTITAVQVGWLIEGIGIPEWTFVATIAGDRTSVTMKDLAGNPVLALGPNHTANGAWYDKDNLVFRQAITMDTTGDTGSQTMTVASTTGISAGMRCYGPALGADGDDLNVWTRVESVINSTSVKVDRAPTTGGTYKVTFYVYNDVFLGVEPTLINNYDATKTYDSTKDYRRIVLKNVFIIQSGGNSLVLRPKCIGFHIDEFCRFTNGYGFGVSITGCNDGYWARMGNGSHWKGCTSIAGSSTPRGSGETFFTYLNHLYYEHRFQGIREGQIYDMEINGRAYFRGVVGGDSAPMISVHNINFKWAPNNRIPYGRTTEYIVCDNVVVNAAQGGFKAARDVITPTAADVTANGSWGPIKPDRIVTTLNGGALYVGLMNWTDDITLKECPYLLTRTNENRMFGSYWNTTVQQEVSAQRFNFTPTFGFATTGGLSVAYTEQYGYVTCTGGLAYFHAVVSFTPTFTGSTFGTARMQGLPIPAMALDTRVIPLQARFGDTSGTWSSGIAPMSAGITPSGNIIIYRNGWATPDAYMTAADFTSGTPYKFEVWGAYPIMKP